MKKKVQKTADTTATKTTTDSIIDETLYGEVISKHEADASDRKMGIHAQDEYRYFNLRKIKDSFELTAKTRKDCQEILKRGKLKLENFSSGFVESVSREPVCRFICTGYEEKYGYKTGIKVTLYVSKNKVINFECDCDECMGRYYWAKNHHCKYTAAALDIALDYLEKNDNMDATDTAGRQVTFPFRCNY